MVLQSADDMRVTGRPDLGEYGGLSIKGRRFYKTIEPDDRTSMRLYHFSDNPMIDHFQPRPVRVASPRAPGLEWLNGPLVWAIEDRFDFLYHFPRDCPRILAWATDRTTAADRGTWLGPHGAVAYIEEGWQLACASAVLWRYTLPHAGFEDLGDAGMWVSRRPVSPTRRDRLDNLPESLARRGVDLRIVPSLVPLRQLRATSLHVSGIRLRNALDWT